MGNTYENDPISSLDFSHFSTNADGIDGKRNYELRREEEEEKLAKSKKETRSDKSTVESSVIIVMKCETDNDFVSFFFST